ncbi:cytochrome c nitrite reductase pentaheme subunit [Edwardsiella ictaluri]|uniref:cytochrome c nitrite reductase pentaheme subunit n=1 Tax=Edwardsiella ictaluri TaxID=67780 RepID=UPI0024156994|nr:cytochrome c nitrite reductase pentaheme subunit [Edwardsiella ictaluri]WFO08987.1 cytochrome c nitrite reductase pentaheme subunit [Edwardsiella ictaluri]
MNLLRSLFTAGALVSGLLLSTPSLSTPPTAGGGATPAQAEVVLQRDPNQGCLDCHKTPQDRLHGRHSQEKNPNTGSAIACSNCHGNVSLERHRDGAPDVMRFNRDGHSAAQQNSVCMSCHLPEKLQKAFWPHDVHLAAVSCAACHSLHPQSDPVIRLNERERVVLCVDCHRQQQDNPAFDPAAVTLKMPGKELRP